MTTLREVSPDVFVIDDVLSTSCCARYRETIRRLPRKDQPNSMNKYGVTLAKTGPCAQLVRNLWADAQRVAREDYPECKYGLRLNPYAFAIEYAMDTQRSLRAHLDSSDVTINLCLGGDFEGGELVLMGPGKKRFVYAPPRLSRASSDAAHARRADERGPVVQGEKDEGAMSDEKKIRPLGDRVIVKRDKADEKVGAIYVPENARSQEARGTVIAVGPGRVLESGRLIEPSVKKGDRVIFSKYAGQEQGQRFEPESEHVILREDDIFGVIEP